MDACCIHAQHFTKTHGIAFFSAPHLSSSLQRSLESMDPISPDFGAVDIHAEASGVQAFFPFSFFCFVLGTTAAYLKSRWVCVRDSESSTTAAYNMSSGRAEQYQGRANHTSSCSDRQWKEARNITWHGTRHNKSDSVLRPRTVKGNVRC